MDASSVDWSSNQSYELSEKAIGLVETFSEIENSLWIQTSGSTTEPGKLKYLALKKDSVLEAAKASNSFLSVHSGERFFLALSARHIAGVSIYARAWLCQGQVIRMQKGSWDAERFVNELAASNAQHCSLVPAMLFDICQGKLRAPASLKTLLVGAGALSESLYKEARQLGWPVLPTYGSTETCSQIATAPLSSLQRHEFPELELLPHMQAKTDGEGRLFVKSTALVWGQALVDEEEVKWTQTFLHQGFFKTNDQVELTGRCLKFLGRMDRVQKIKGHLVNMDSIQTQVFDENQKAIVASELDERAGQRLIAIAAASSFDQVLSGLQKWNQTASSEQKIRSVYWLLDWPQSSLGKPLFARILKQIN